MEPAYQYRASLIRAIDGDTFELAVDVGFKIHNHAIIRLRGIDTPERNTPEGKAAQAFAAHALTNAQQIVVRTFKDQQSFARWVADIWIDGYPLADVLRAAGYEKRRSA
jgi:micrococcal nuclease